MSWAGPYAIRNFSLDSGYGTVTTPTSGQTETTEATATNATTQPNNSRRARKTPAPSPFRRQILKLNPPNPNNRVNKRSRQHKKLILNPPRRHPVLKLHPPHRTHFSLAAQEKSYIDNTRPDHERLHRTPTPFPQPEGDEEKDYIWICCPEVGEPIPRKQPDMRLVMTSLGKLWMDFNDVESGRYEDILM